MARTWRWQRFVVYITRGKSGPIRSMQQPAGELIDLGEIRLRLLVTRATARHVG
jgi:hypothetical protein